MACAIRTAICRRRSRPQGNIRVTIAAAATLCNVGMARTSIVGTVNATQPERSRRSIRKVAAITAAEAMKVAAATTIRTDALGSVAQNLDWLGLARRRPLRPAQLRDSFCNHRDERSHGVRLRQPSERGIGLAP